MIRAARGLVGMDQAELAKAVGVTAKTISMIEREISHREDERRTKIVRQIRDHLMEVRRLTFLYREGRKGEGVRLRLP